MKTSILYFVFLCCYAFPLQAQEDCGTTQVHRTLMAVSPDYARQTARNDGRWTAYQQQLKAARIVVSGTDTVYEVPVVFHIIHSGEPLGTVYNPADSVIDSALAFLNKAFAATWSGYPDTTTGGVYVPIRFVPARRDPDCKPTNGITRTDGRFITDYERYGISLGAKETQLKEATAWPNTNYYNIWVVRRIDGYSGYAYFSPSAGILDGTMVDLGGIYPATGTHTYRYLLPHEVGHGFSLYHTFEGGTCLDTNCLINGDQICDTEPHTVRGCASGTNACTGLPWGDVRYNYMNYSDGCANRFTRIQGDRMMFSLLGERISLLYSPGLTPPDMAFTLSPPACLPVAPTSGRDFGPHNVFLENLASFSYGFINEGRKGYLDKTCFYEPAQLKQGKTYNLKVSSGLEYQFNRAWIDYNNDGIFTLSEEVLQTDTYYGNYSTQTDTFTIPRKGVVCGRPLRLRVISDLLAGGPDDTLSPCHTLITGQVEDFSVIIEVDSAAPTGMISLAENNISIYPNPATDLLRIENAQETAVSVYSPEGKLLLQVQNTCTVNISSLSNGFYLLRITDLQTGQTLKHHKFLKLAH